MFLIFVPSFFPLQHEEQSSWFCFSSQISSICNSKNLLGFYDCFSVEEKPIQQTPFWEFYWDLALRHQITYTHWITALENRWGWKAPLEIFCLFKVEMYYSGLCPLICWRPTWLKTPKPPWAFCANVWAHKMKTFFPCI